MNKACLRAIVIGGVSIGAMMVGGAVSAQTATAQAAAPDDVGLAEIVVTAQKRTENQQNVPIAVTQVSAASVKNFGALKTDDLTMAVPGLQIQHEINSVTAFLRGVGPNSNGTGQESSVAIYLDDLYIMAGNASIFDLNAITGVQVLKGPQGTIFGRNATGGVIQVQTRNPESEATIDAHAGYGNYWTKSGDIYVGGPIVDDKLAANLTASLNRESKGWGRDVITNERAFTSNVASVRGKLLFTPTDTTRILGSVNYFYTRGQVGLGFNQVPSYAAQGYPLLLPIGSRYVGFYNNQNYKNDVAIIRNRVAELRVDQETPIAKIVNILGWQRFNGFAQFAQDGSPAALVATKLIQRGREFTEEFQLLNPTGASYSDWLTWIAGAYYMKSDAGYDNAELRGAAFGFPIQTSPNTYYLALKDAVNTASIAGFGQATIKVAERLNITGGFRYTHDRRIFTGGVRLSPALGGGPAGPITTASSPGARRTYNMVTYKGSVDYHVTDDAMVYASYNRGVKSGQFDTFGTAFSGPIATPAVNPEVLRSIEGGLKSELLDRRLRVNVSLFHYNIKNLQFAVIVAGGTRLVNAAGAIVNGAEADVAAKLSRNFTVTGAIALQKGHYTSFPGAPAYFNPPTNTIDAAGNPTVHTPRFTANLNADYSIPTEHGDFDLNVAYAHTSPFEFFPDKSLQQRTTDLFNASLLWTAPSKHFDVRVWGANLTGVKYFSFGSESQGLGKQFSPAAPRTYGVTAGLHF